jgi:hypothetical protein
MTDYDCVYQSIATSQMLLPSLYFINLRFKIDKNVNITVNFYLKKDKVETEQTHFHEEKKSRICTLQFQDMVFTNEMIKL